MKRKTMMKTFVYFLLAGSMAMVGTSCSSDSEGSGGAPMIESVAAAADANLEPVTVGYAANMYVIHGSGFATTQKIYFNDTDTYFNPVLVTDTDIFVTIDRDTPYADVSNKLRVVTKNGEAEFDFVVAPPAPGVHSFNPINAADGQEITIYGSYFLNPVVMVGNNQAQVVSSTLTEIHAILPAGSQNKKVTVTTISGSAEYGTAVGTAIYDDVFYSPWNIESWNNHEYVTNFAQAAQGTTFIKKSIEGWGNIQGNWNWNDQLSNYTGIHFFLRSDDAGKLVWIVNGNGWGNADHAITTSKDWKEVRLTWAQLGNPAALQNISFQEFTGSTHNYYIDNIGFTVD
ncbi:MULTISPECIES: IPT/TIG domain-containing protein [unclassified Flavobacterium]|uniref:IPT/TIG domain-containing protein n=1 Tax=unclassified Flavobacterium TaxID=196869 RepID=UPI001F131787|nr:MULTISPECIES: IPT/TIG domain-containing protein [unclassified Flavobacterium]UMY65410.1 IPT/TIG domain-containing protein [Flavobacterium sp. HJ-32-4]